MLFGGGSHGAGDFVVHVAMLPCLMLGAMRWRWADASGWQRAFLAWWLVAIGYVVLQLVPMPPALFERMPQRAGVLADLARAGIAPGWRPMTLDAWATVRALLALVGFGAIWLLASTLDAHRWRILSLIALGLGVALALLGFAQAAGGPHAIRFFDFHHETGALGTFANRNHFATLLAMLLPLALAQAARAQREQRPGIAAAAFAATVVLWLAAALTFSRTGFVLASASLVASVAILWWPRALGTRRWIAPALAVGVALLAAGHYALDGLLHRLDQDPMDDLRWQYLRNGLHAMHAWLPWGSGLGTFPWIYAPFEPVAQMHDMFAERAHNDVLQVAIEAGIPGLLLIAAFTFIFVYAARNFLMGRGRATGDDPARSVIAVALAVPLLHSLVDYPLRTAAVAVLAGLLLSFNGEERQASA